MTPSHTSSPIAFARSPKDPPMHPTTTTPTNGSGSTGGSRRRPRARHAASVVTALAAAVVATLGLTAAPVLADDCSNATLRAENNSTQLPDCRAYELVTNPFKEGFQPVPIAFDDNGRLIYQSNGNFANNGLGRASGNSYFADRSPSGWTTTAASPSGPLYNAGINSQTRFSSDLHSSLWVMSRPDEPIGVGDFYLGRADGTFTRIGPTIDPATIPPAAPGGTAQPLLVPHVGGSGDLSHVVFVSNFDQASGVSPSDLYEYVGTGHDRPRLVDVDNAGQLISSCGIIGNNYQQNPWTLQSGQRHAVSADGRVIFFTSQCPAPAVYARVNGTTTIKASASQCTRAPADPGGACNAGSAPSFEGANAEGTRVFLTTSQQLVNGDTDATQDLYECDIPAGTPAPVGQTNPCPDLHEVSGAATGANVQGVTRISEDGSRVYFVATGVLASNHGANDAAAVDGDNNLYVWQRNAAHPGGQTTFVGKLDPSDGGGGGVWGQDNVGRPAQTTDDGRYLVFASRAPLIDNGPQADTDTAADVYRYDADTGELARLSTDVDGTGANDSVRDAHIVPNRYDEALSSDRPRGAMSDDGGSVVFTTNEGLSPTDTNGTYDTYLWHDGQVSLISSGGPSLDSTLVGRLTIMAGVSPSGRDVYFETTAQLTANDVDTQIDMYDARVDGGFDLSSPPPCAGDGCQGGRSAPPPASQPGSSSSTGQDNPPAFSVKPLTVNQLGRVTSTGRVSLSVTTNAPGTLTAMASATIAKRPSSVGSAKRNVASAGTVSLTLMLSKKARAELKSKRKLTVKVLVRQDNVAIARTVSLKLTQPKAAKRAQKKASRTRPRHAAARGVRS
jgi:hypothetical protein